MTKQRTKNRRIAVSLRTGLEPRAGHPDAPAWMGPRDRQPIAAANRQAANLDRDAEKLERQARMMRTRAATVRSQPAADDDDAFDRAMDRLEGRDVPTMTSAEFHQLYGDPDPLEQPHRRNAYGGRAR